MQPVSAAAAAAVAFAAVGVGDGDDSAMSAVKSGFVRVERSASHL